MVATVTMLVSALVSASGDAHADANELYRQLTGPGLKIGFTEVSRKLPGFAMSDGLTPEQQQAVLAEAVRGKNSVQDFVDDGLDAPFAVKVSKMEQAAPDVQTRRFSVAFVAHGNLDSIASKSFRQRFIRLSREKVRCHELTGAELKDLGIQVRNPDNVFYTNYDIPLYDSVQLSETKRNEMSRTPESIVVASLLDPTFVGAKKYPNQWRKYSSDERGDASLGPAQRYNGAATVLKITKLARPKGGLFIEFHAIYMEPRGWFSGTEFLASKIPLLAKIEVRGFREELKKEEKESVAGRTPAPQR